MAEPDTRASPEERDFVDVREGPERWDEPFGPDMTEKDVRRLLDTAPFDRMDPDHFPDATPLRGILRNDTRIRHYEHGDIVVREGDYGNSAFLILSGQVRVDISPEDELPATVLGRREPDEKTLWEAFAQLWRNSRLPETRDSAGSAALEGAGQREDEAGHVRLFLQDVPAVLEACRTVTLSEGQFFGEVAALGRIPRTATVFADGEAEVLEIRWQGLRDIMRRDPELKEHIHRIYRERNLETHLLSTPLFQHLDHRDAPDDCDCGKCRALREIVEATRFDTWGDFDWHVTYQRLVDERTIESEPVIARQGHYANGIILVRSGFARVSRRFGEGHRTLGYLSRGQVYGLEETIRNWRDPEDPVPLQNTLRAVGYASVLMVPTRIVEKYVLGPDRDDPIVSDELLPELGELEGDDLPVPGAAGGGEEGARDVLEEGEVDQDLVEFLVGNRFVNGTAAMVINLDRCTQCDDCVTACASTHDGNPRFLRHGKRVGNVQVANACMHCQDPVCMIGCPTGAIHRDLEGGEVVINDTTCIGCGTCAHSCPYDNIRLVEIRNRAGEMMLDADSGRPVQKATKCDLCSDQPTGPACQRACPHDALTRMDLSDPDELAALAEWAEA